MVEDSESRPAPIMKEETSEQVAGRMAGYITGGATAFVVGLADSLGMFQYMAGKPPSTSAEIADGAKLHERFVREMLYQLTTAQLVSADQSVEKFWLSEGQANVLANETGPKSSPFCLLGLTNSLIEGMGKFRDVQNSIRTGKGLKYDDYGEGMACAICRDVGVWTRHFLVNYIRSVPELHERLEKGAMCADIGCGAGLALQELATAYPNSTFHGFDTSTKAISRAQDVIKGLPNITLYNPDLPEQQMGEAKYDFLITNDAIHDMAHPDRVLSIARKALKDDGWGYLIADFKCKETCAENIAMDRDIAMLGYGASVMLCLNSAMSDQDSMGLGTLGWHPKLAEKMLKEAGFSGFQQLDWKSELNNFYWAKP